VDRRAGTRRDAAGGTGPVSGFLDGALRAHAAGALGAGLPCSGGERRLLQVTASLAAGIPVDLRDAVAGLDRRNARLVAGAVLHASGHQDMP
jgi:hypothetical protein